MDIEKSTASEEQEPKKKKKMKADWMWDRYIESDEFSSESKLLWKRNKISVLWKTAKTKTRCLELLWMKKRTVYSAIYKSTLVLTEVGLSL